MSSKTALITGISGQDGIYLARHLMALGYRVHGLKRDGSVDRASQLAALVDEAGSLPGELAIHSGDLADTDSIESVIEAVQPDEMYNLGAQSQMECTLEQSEYTAETNGLGALRLLDGLRKLGLEHKTRYFQACSAELFGKADVSPQTEETGFHPRSVYSVAKLFAYWLGRNYRETMGMYVCNGILYNHESPLRGEAFVTRKITRAVAAIAAGQQDRLELGNLDTPRDWGYAGDFVRGMHLMLQQDQSDDYILATGRLHTVRQFVEKAFGCTGCRIDWKGSGLEEVGYDAATGKQVVRVNPDFYRPSEPHPLCGDASKAKARLGWEHQTTLDELISTMVKADVAALARAGAARRIA